MIVIKYGGNAMRDGNGFFATAIKDSLASGESVVVVHGGGPQINQALAEAGITSEFVGGYRVTTPEILIVVDDVLTKNVGPRIAAGLSNAGVPSESISGRTFLTGEILLHRNLW